MRSFAFAAAAALTLALAACGTSQYEDDPLYDAGFSDGCATGNDRSGGGPVAKPQRDQELWDTSDTYRAGWKAGYRSCGPSAGEIPGDRDPNRY